jgi:hypothetical protein
MGAARPQDDAGTLRRIRDALDVLALRRDDGEAEGIHHVAIAVRPGGGPEVVRGPRLRFDAGVERDDQGVRILQMTIGDISRRLACAGWITAAQRQPRPRRQVSPEPVVRKDGVNRPSGLQFRRTIAVSLMEDLRTCRSLQAVSGTLSRRVIWHPSRTRVPHA